MYGPKSLIYLKFEHFPYRTESKKHPGELKETQKNLKKPEKRC